MPGGTNDAPAALDITISRPGENRWNSTPENAWLTVGSPNPNDALPPTNSTPATNRTFIRFDWADVSGNIPPLSRVIEARLDLVLGDIDRDASSSEANLTASRLALDNWNEQTIQFDSPATETAVLNIPPGMVPGTIGLNVTPHVAEELGVTGRSNTSGWRLSVNTEVPQPQATPGAGPQFINLTFASSQNGTPANHPKLVIRFDPGDPKFHGTQPLLVSNHNVTPLASTSTSTLVVDETDPLSIEVKLDGDSFAQFDNRRATAVSTLALVAPDGTVAANRSLPRTGNLTYRITNATTNTTDAWGLEPGRFYSFHAFIQDSQGRANRWDSLAADDRGNHSTPTGIFTALFVRGHRMAGLEETTDDNDVDKNVGSPSSGSASTDIAFSIENRRSTSTAYRVVVRVADGFDGETVPFTRSNLTVLNSAGVALACTNDNELGGPTLNCTTASIAAGASATFALRATVGSHLASAGTANLTFETRGPAGHANETISGIQSTLELHAFAIPLTRVTPFIVIDGTLTTASRSAYNASFDRASLVSPQTTVHAAHARMSVRNGTAIGDETYSFLRFDWTAWANNGTIPRHSAVVDAQLVLTVPTTSQTPPPLRLRNVTEAWSESVPDIETQVDAVDIALSHVGNKTTANVTESVARHLRFFGNTTTFGHRLSINVAGPQSVLIFPWDAPNVSERARLELRIDPLPPRFSEDAGKPPVIVQTLRNRSSFPSGFVIVDPADRLNITANFQNPTNSASPDYPSPHWPVENLSTARPLFVDLAIYETGTGPGGTPAENVSLVRAARIPAENMTFFSNRSVTGFGDTWKLTPGKDYYFHVFANDSANQSNFWNSSVPTDAGKYIGFPAVHSFLRILPSRITGLEPTQTTTGGPNDQRAVRVLSPVTVGNPAATIVNFTIHNRVTAPATYRVSVSVDHSWDGGATFDKTNFSLVDGPLSCATLTAPCDTRVFSAAEFRVLQLRVQPGSGRS
ncbi:MAG: hypothetical protein ACT4PT_01665, partial [Methanobacteriota archaeon]